MRLCKDRTARNTMCLHGATAYLLWAVPALRVSLLTFFTVRGGIPAGFEQSLQWTSAEHNIITCHMKPQIA
eukprot:2622589-Amphidinium_carterae.1